MSKISTKNILKKIFKGKTDKKVKKKVSKKKVVKAKKAKKAKKIISKKIKKVVKKVTPKLTKTKKAVKITETTAEPKVDNLRISKTNEVKPEIKKVKKQETEKREYKIKDHVVYPKHGVGQITEFKKINIGGIDVETYVIKFEKDSNFYFLKYEFTTTNENEKDKYFKILDHIIETFDFKEST